MQDAPRYKKKGPNPIEHVDHKGGWSKQKQETEGGSCLLCSSSFAMMCWLWSAASTSFATCVLAFSKFSAMQMFNSQTCSQVMRFSYAVFCGGSVPLRSLLKSCSLLISATSLLLSVCSRCSLLVLPCISVS